MTAVAQLKTLFVITLTTARMIFPGLPFSTAPETNGGPGFDAAAKSISIGLTTQNPYNIAAKAECTLPQGLGYSSSAKFTIVPLSDLDAKAPGKGDSGNSTPLKVYWGSTDVIAQGQPKVVSHSDVAAGIKDLSAAAGSAASDKEGSYAYWPGEQVKPLSAQATAPGLYNLTTNYCGSTSIKLSPEQDFPSPIDLSGTNSKMDLSKAIPIRWKKLSRARAYLLTAFGGNAKESIAWASSSNQNWMKTADISSRALSGDEVKKLIKDGILLPPDTTSCVIPAGTFKTADTAMLVITAIGPDKIESDNGIRTSVIVRSTATVPLSDWSLSPPQPDADIPPPPKD